MTNYFDNAQNSKIFELIQSTKNPIDSKAKASGVARYILGKCSAKNIELKDGWIIVCDTYCDKEYNFYSEEECSKVVREIEEEIMERFGLHSEVHFLLKEHYEEEPDPIPPLYMGTLDDVYIYELCVKIKL